MSESRKSPTLEGLPGAEIVEAGVADLRAGRMTVNAAAVQMASRRLSRLGMDVVPGSPTDPASHRLYSLLAEEHGNDAHSRYNAIVGRMVSFARAAERARAR